MYTANDANIVLRVCPEDGRILRKVLLPSYARAMQQMGLSHIPRALSRRAKPLGNPKNLAKASTSSTDQDCNPAHLVCTYDWDLSNTLPRSA